MKRCPKRHKRATILVMIVGLLAALFLSVTAYITLARFGQLTLNAVREGRTIDEALKSVTTYARSSIRQSLADGAGNVLAGGVEDPTQVISTTNRVLRTYSDTNIVGGLGTRWLGGSEPVIDYQYLTPGFVAYGSREQLLGATKQSVSVFTEAAPFEQAIPFAPPASPAIGFTNPNPGIQQQIYHNKAGLLLENDYDQDYVMQIRFNAGGGNEDLLRSVRRAWMDADGDGMADTSFTGVAALAELANAVAGVSVRPPVALEDALGNAQHFYASAISDPNGAGSDPDRLLAIQWRNYDSAARYDIAVKVIDNGGLVALMSPEDEVLGNQVWNREFVTGMFNWVRSSRDGTMIPSTNTNRLLTEASRAARSVEPFLRYRGGSIANYAEQSLAAMPAILSDLRDNYPYTFDVAQSINPTWRPNGWQRYNLAAFLANGTHDEWSAFLASSTIDTQQMNKFRGYALGQGQAPRYYNHRNLLTTLSYSDELARDLQPATPDLSPPVAPDDDMGLQTGALKFYLGKIAWCFDQQGYFVPGTPTIPRGHAVIRELANYYYEMLRPYGGWRNSPTTQLQTGDSEAVTRRQQAFMLAVNTVAFAAPRIQSGGGGLGALQNGAIDVVHYTDTDPVSGQLYTYYGYAPQPFITEVHIHNEGEENGGRNAVAVELYYPHDPAPNSTGKWDPADPYALPLQDFAISVNNQDPVSLQAAFQGQPKLSGRHFAALQIDDGNNTIFRAYTPNPIEGWIRDMPVSLTNANGYRQLTVKLWRRSSNPMVGVGGWIVVDEMVVGDGRNGSDRLPGDDAFSWRASFYRDVGDAYGLMKEAFFGDLAPLARPARWRMAGAIHDGDVDQEMVDPNQQMPVSGLIGYLSNASNPSPSMRLAPFVPLYTMNAGANYAPNAGVLIHGSWRPRSFPTVGFLLYVPRFSHTGAQPMSEYLWEQWANPNDPTPPWPAWRTYSAGSERYPADFGHMWIFDNHQEIRNGFYYDDPSATHGGVGKIPWGLLVFDYFTTLQLDENGDGEADIDPLRVPGRINVNTAPWYVLAGLPVVNPHNFQAILNQASPAFWSAASGVMVGQSQATLIMSDNAPLQRFALRSMNPAQTLVYSDAQSGWLRLGPVLAQAIAGYRDRLSYVPDDATALPRADVRNSGSFLERRYRAETQQDLINFAGYAYGEMRRDYTLSSQRSYRGFIGLGEMLNVYGMDSAIQSLIGNGYGPLGARAGAHTLNLAPDFFKAVSLMALLDTHFLTTRSNTFTVYVSIMDKEDPQSSVRAQLTVDRSNCLPKLVTYPTAVDPLNRPMTYQTGLGGEIKPVIIRSDDLPEILVERRSGYFNTRFDK